MQTNYLIAKNVLHSLTRSQSPSCRAETGARGVMGCDATTPRAPVPRASRNMKTTVDELATIPLDSCEEHYLKLLININGFFYQK